MSFRFGLENLDTSKKYGKTGIITNATGVTSGLEQNVDYLLGKGVSISRIFSPEHGFYSTYFPGEEVPDEKYRNIPVNSLYSEGSKEVDREVLKEFDTVFYDIQDAGVRFYTYLSTLHNLLKAASGTSTRIIVLDRPNPIRSDIVEGPLLEEKYISFVGTDLLPTRYGMTIGEAAFFLNRNARADLEVVKMTGYSRSAFYDDLVGSFVPFSWNLPGMNSVINYIGMCIFEASSASIGRGTPYPFTQIGFPGIWESVKNNHAGIHLRKTEFRPLSEPLANTRVPGYFVHITDRSSYSPLYTWIEVFYDLYAKELLNFREDWIRLIFGNNDIAESKSNELVFKEMAQKWSDDVESFKEVRSGFTLY